MAGNPETLTDPTGHRRDCSEGDCGGGSGKGSDDGKKQGKGSDNPPRDPTKGGVPNDAVWSWHDANNTVVVYLRGPEWDAKSGWHYNLVIKLWNGEDIYNYHLTFAGQTTTEGCPCNSNVFAWHAKNFVPGKSDDPVKVLASFEADPGSASLDAETELSAIVAQNVLEVVPSTVRTAIGKQLQEGGYFSSATNAFSEALFTLYTMQDAPPPS